MPVTVTLIVAPVDTLEGEQLAGVAGGGAKSFVTCTAHVLLALQYS